MLTVDVISSARRLKFIGEAQAVHGARPIRLPRIYTVKATVPNKPLFSELTASTRGRQKRTYADIRLHTIRVVACRRQLSRSP